MSEFKNLGKWIKIPPKSNRRYNFKTNSWEEISPVEEQRRKKKERENLNRSIYGPDSND